MRKLIVLLSILALVAFSVPGYTCEGNNCGDAYAGFKVGAKSGSGALDYDVKFIPNGAAGGIGGAIGGAKANASGHVWNGKTSGDVSTIGGGLTTTEAYRFNLPGADRSIGVGSASKSYAITGADAKIKVKAPEGYGHAHASIKGGAAQGTLNGSTVGESPIFFDSDGRSSGVAGQGSIGGFHGSADVMGGKGKAKIGAEIEMYGNSYSESYRYVNYGPDSKTEGMGTNVGAYTTVNSSKYTQTKGKYARARVGGGWVAGGIAATKTTQDAPGFGGAKAYGVGYYVGSGGLGCNFEGSATGYSYTSVTTFNNMNGSINTAGAGMSVHAQTSRGGDPR